jgi:hypothetical protein
MIANNALSRGPMRARLVIQGLFWFCLINITACEQAPSSDWVLLSEDSEGKPTFIDGESIRWSDGGIAVYTRAVGDPSAPDRVEFVQGLDCTNLRWAFFTLDESLLDSIAGATLFPEEWELLELNPANRVLVDTVCEGFPPTRWIRVLKENPEGPGDLRDVWVDRETLTGPIRDSVWTEMEDLGYSEEIVRSWSRWNDASPDSGYLLMEADVACDKGVLRYLENSRYSKEGELVSRADTTEFWYILFEASFEREVFSVVCRMQEFFPPEPGRPEPGGPELTPGTSPGGD